LFSLFPEWIQPAVRHYRIDVRDTAHGREAKSVDVRN
jgi:hypothetical protein